MADKFVAAALAGEPVEVHGDGRQTRDFTYVSSVAEVLADAVARRVGHPSPVNLAFGTRTDLLTLVALLSDVTGRRLEARHVAARPGDVRDSQAGVETMRQLFPHARPHDLRAALAA
nr:NAD-dependent epimerase/dehydratase family protein [Micromonospora sp. DSM 115978]